MTDLSPTNPIRPSARNLELGEQDLAHIDDVRTSIEARKGKELIPLLHHVFGANTLEHAAHFAVYLGNSTEERTALVSHIEKASRPSLVKFFAEQLLTGLYGKFNFLALTPFLRDIGIDKATKAELDYFATGIHTAYNLVKKGRYDLAVAVARGGLQSGALFKLFGMPVEVLKFRHNKSDIDRSALPTNPRITREMSITKDGAIKTTIQTNPNCTEDDYRAYEEEVRRIHSSIRLSRSWANRSSDEMRERLAGARVLVLESDMVTGATAQAVAEELISLGAWEIDLYTAIPSSCSTDPSKLPSDYRQLIHDEDMRFSYENYGKAIALLEERLNMIEEAKWKAPDLLDNDQNP